MSRTLQATDEGLSTAFLALKRKRWTKSSQMLCDKSLAGRSTLKRFWAGNAISREYFISICKALEVDWQSISTVANNASPKKWIIQIQINVTSEMVQKIAGEIEKLLRRYSGDSTLYVYESREGSIILFVESSLEGYERIEYLFQQGQLNDLLDAPVSRIKLKPISLGEWLQGNFVDAINLAWQEPLTSFADASAVRRVKDVYLTDDISIQLLLSIENETEQSFRVLVRVSPNTETSNVLPRGFKIQIFNQSDELLGEQEVDTGAQVVELPILGLEREERFKLALILDDEEYSEEFEI